MYYVVARHFQLNSQLFGASANLKLRRYLGGIHIILTHSPSIISFFFFFSCGGGAGSAQAAAAARPPARAAAAAAAALGFGGNRGDPRGPHGEWVMPRHVTDLLGKRGAPGASSREPKLPFLPWLPY